MAWLTDVALRRRAGAVYERGRWCVRWVESLVVDGDAATAVVRSQSDELLRYRVRLHGPGPAGECDCPQGLEGRFCKHCVAVGLRVLGAEHPPEPEPAELPVPAPRADEWPAVRAFLAGRPAPELAGLLLGLARDDAGVRHRLWLLATADADEAVADEGVAPIEAEVQALARGYGGGEGARYATQVRATAYTLTHLPARDAARASELLQLAVAHTVEALVAGTAEDPDDDEEDAPDDDGPVFEALGVAWHALLRLCDATPPAPQRLAAWFVGLRLRHPSYRSNLPAADLAGVPGVLAACRAELRGREGAAAWSLHDEVLRALGDIDAHVAFLAEDLATYARFAQIAGLLDGAGRAEEAVTWLERARRPESPPGDDPAPVVELLARLYTRQGRLDEALQVRRRHFATARTDHAFRALREAARRAGADWPPLRDGALDVLRRDQLGRPDTLVRILVEEGAAQEAWELANQRRCTQDTMVAAARARAVTHPADAIPVYRSLLAAALNFHSRDRDRAYERAADLLLILRDLITRSGGSFPDELAAFKRAHGRKTNLMAALARRGV